MSNKRDAEEVIPEAAPSLRGSPRAGVSHQASRQAPPFKHHRATLRINQAVQAVCFSKG
jgi:hypothetical protein